MANEMIGHYRVLAALAEGSMGAVYCAYDERLGREVAIKVLKNRGDVVAIERFRREARAASALNHPNIVTVFESGEIDHGHYIVMELVRGRVLRSLIGQAIDFKQLSSLARQTAEALSVAHRAGIVHRDIKPENVMVRDDGYVKVLDFGLAHLTAPPTATMQTVAATQVRTVVGTIKYMSPEQALDKLVGSPSDVFSLGVVLYELATGRHPFEAESLYGVLHAIVSQEPVPPSRLNPELPGRLNTLILRMLDKHASRRPSALDVTAEMERPAPGVAWRVSSAPSAPGRHSVGHVKARVELHAALEYVRKGRGLLVCVSGEPGIGKSTLVDDFFLQNMDSSRPCYVARGRCSERLAGTEAYLPLLDALEDLLRSDEGALARLMKAVAPLWYAQVSPAPALASSAGEAVAPLLTGTQERLKRELVAFLADACRQQPIILFFDDLHWVDLSTVDMLGYVASQFESSPVLIIVTYRPEELLVQKHPFLAMKHDLQSRGLCREMALEFLTRHDIEQYIALRFAGHRLPRSFVDLIFEKTEGNPLFVVEVLSYLSEQQVLSRQSGQWTLTRSVPDIARELPESVRGMIHRKIDTLAETERRILLTASVQGYEFDGVIVATILRIDPSDLEELLDRIDRVRGFVRPVREQEYPDGTLTLRYRFVHVFYQNVLYASLTPTRKIALSRAIGKVLEDSYRDQTADIASELAVLYETAREFVRAADCFRIAARKAADLFAYEESFVLGQRALKALRAAEDSPDLRRRELAILTTIAVATSASRGFSGSEVQELCDRAAVLCLELNETQQLVSVLYRLIAFNAVRLRVETAQDMVARLTLLVRDSADSRLSVHAINGIGLVSYYLGEFETAVQHFTRMTSYCTLEVRRSVCAAFGYDPASLAYGYLAWSLWCLGYPDRAARAIEDALRAADEVQFRYALANALTFACAVDCWRGDWQRLRVNHDRTFALATEGLSYYLATSTFIDGLLLAKDEQRGLGLVRMREGRDGLLALEGRTTLRRFATEFARQLALAGNVAEALDLIGAEIDAMQTDRFWEAELLRVKGELLLMRADPSGATEAEACFHRAIDVAQRQCAKAFELRAVTSLSRLWHSLGKVDQAAQRLSEIYDWFTEGFDTGDLTEARELLAELGVAVG